MSQEKFEFFLPMNIDFAFEALRKFALFRYGGFEFELLVMSQFFFDPVDVCTHFITDPKDPDVLDGRKSATETQPAYIIIRDGL